MGLEVAGPDLADGVRVEVYRSLAEAEPFLRDLALRDSPWTFDIETYDAGQFPSRKEVAVDPCHPDFRVRGCAFALSKHLGVWVDFGMQFQDTRVQPDPLLGPSTMENGLVALRAAFASDAEKAAFNGGFDENGLVYQGWVPEIRNRTRDGMLALIGLGDGTHEFLRLSHVVPTLLGYLTYWDEDKSMVRELPVEVVAAGAVRDACRTHELCDLLDGWAVEDRYVEWSRMKKERGTA